MGGYPQEVGTELHADWIRNIQGKTGVEHMPPPKGILKNPNYELTPEKIKKAAEKLRAEIKEREDVFAAVERRKRALAAEPKKMLSGRRYAV